MRFTFNPAIIGEIEESPGMADALRDAAETIAGIAEETHRMRSTPGRYGEIVVESPRPGLATVAAMGPFAHLDEWGGAKSAPNATMRNAVISAGYKFEER